MRCEYGWAERFLVRASDLTGLSTDRLYSLAAFRAAMTALSYLEGRLSKLPL